jgi:hypothetical protein
LHTQYLEYPSNVDRIFGELRMHKKVFTTT